METLAKKDQIIVQLTKKKVHNWMLIMTHFIFME
jgi:hypothetical protein